MVESFYIIYKNFLPSKSTAPMSSLTFFFWGTLFLRKKDWEKDFIFKKKSLTCVRKACNHRVIILNRGSMFAFQWREFSPPLSSAHRRKTDRRRCNSQGTQNTYFSLSHPPTTRANSQWARSLEWRCTLQSGRIASLSSRSLARHALSI